MLRPSWTTPHDDRRQRAIEALRSPRELLGSSRGRPRGAAAPGSPPWLALIDEGLHALERRLLQHVAGHGLAGRRVRRLEAELDLGVEELLAHRDDRSEEHTSELQSPDTIS